MAEKPAADERVGFRPNSPPGRRPSESESVSPDRLPRRSVAYEYLMDCVLAELGKNRTLRADLIYDPTRMQRISEYVRIFSSGFSSASMEDDECRQAVDTVVSIVISDLHAHRTPPPPPGRLATEEQYVPGRTIARTTALPLLGRRQADAGLASYTAGLLTAAAFMALAIGPGWLGFFVGFLPVSLLTSWTVASNA